MMDPTTIQQLVAEYPEGYRGGRIDRTRPIGQTITVEVAWANAERCLADDNQPRAAYWAGFAAGEE